MSNADRWPYDSAAVPVMIALIHVESQMQTAGPNDLAAGPVLVALIHGGCQMQTAGPMIVQPLR